MRRTSLATCSLCIGLLAGCVANVDDPGEDNVDEQEEAAGANLLKNGDFEAPFEWGENGAWLHNWQAHGQQDVEVGQDPSSTWHEKGDGLKLQGGGWVRQAVPVCLYGQKDGCIRPGVVYKLLVRGRSHDSNSRAAEVGVSYWDYDGTMIGKLPSKEFPIDGDWHWRTTKFRLPVSTNTPLVSVYMHCGFANGRCDFDDARLVRAN